MEDYALITKEELSKVQDSMLNIDQVNFLLQRTPAKFIYERPAKGGGKWSYVTGSYVRKVLNMMFGWNWDFTVEQFDVNLEARQIIVLGKLVVRTGAKEVTKMQFGRKDIAYRKDGKTLLDMGNDLKAATTDALKKCASELGIASDIYAPNEYKAVQVMDEKEEEINDALTPLNELLEVYEGEDKMEIQQMVLGKIQAGEINETFINEIIQKLK